MHLVNGCRKFPFRFFKYAHDFYAFTAKKSKNASEEAFFDPFQFFLLFGRKISAPRKEKITAAVTPALAADRGPVIA